MERKTIVVDPTTCFPGSCGLATRIAGLVDVLIMRSCRQVDTSKQNRPEIQQSPSKMLSTVSEINIGNIYDGCLHGFSSFFFLKGQY